jgi:c-di-GMP-binding flagellar brake protein YcgR
MTESSEAANADYNYEEMKPRIGDPVQLNVQTSTASERYAVNLVGLVKGRTVIVTAPILNGSVVLMREGQSVIVRSFSGTDAYGYASSVLRVCNSPIPYLHLAYPKSVKGVAVRKSARAHFNLIGSVVNKQEIEEAKGYAVIITDISVSGASFTASEAIANKGDAITLSFRAKPNDIESYPVINCIVKSIVDEGGIGGDTLKLHYGVQFKDLPQDTSLLLQNMIYKKLLENA